MGRLQRLEESSARWICVIGDIHVAVGDPVEGRADNMYLPSWIIGACGLEGAGEKVDMRFERCESFLKAEKLGFQVVGEAPRDMDFVELLEEPLSQLGVIQKGQIIPVPVLEGVYLILTTCEPDGQVFLDGAEISLEIEDDLGGAEEGAELAAELADKAAAEQPPEPVAESPHQMLPYFPSPSAPVPSVRKGFIPFQGTGHRLCD
jgi:hypothetical protein